MSPCGSNRPFVVQAGSAQHKKNLLELSPLSAAPESIRSMFIPALAAENCKFRRPTFAKRLRHASHSDCNRNPVFAELAEGCLFTSPRILFFSHFAQNRFHVGTHQPPLKKNVHFNSTTGEAILETPAHTMEFHSPCVNRTLGTSLPRFRRESVSKKKSPSHFLFLAFFPSRCPPERRTRLTLAPIWFPHCPAWMWTISLMVKGFFVS